MNDTYRVFVSYSSKDKVLASQLVDHLHELGLLVLWDKEVKPGKGFSEQIQGQITHSRVFLPLITPKSLTRGWVQQEIGFALGRNIPVIPVGVGATPKGIIDSIQAYALQADLSDLTAKITREDLDREVESAERDKPSFFECARDHVQRGLMMARYANSVSDMKFYACVRQKGALTSFHIPNRPISDVSWVERYDNRQPIPTICDSLLKERKALEVHAQRAGCKLIIEPLLPEYYSHSLNSWRARIEVILRFLEEAGASAVAVVNEAAERQHSLTVLGDWFSAEAVTADVQGYRHTIFSRNATEVRAELESFDAEFEHLLKRRGVDEAGATAAAIADLRAMIMRREQNG